MIQSKSIFPFLRKLSYVSCFPVAGKPAESSGTSIKVGRGPESFSTAASTTDRNCVSAKTTLASPCSKIYEMVPISKRVLIVFKIAPHAGTPKCASA